MSESTPLLSDARIALATQRSTLAQEEESLQYLSRGVAGIHDIAEAIRKEAAEQNVILDGLTAKVAGVMKGAEDATRSVDALEVGERYTPRLFCMLLWPMVLLMVMVLEAIRSLLE